MVSNTESNALAKQLPIGYSIQNYTIKAYLNQSYFANCYLVEVPSTGENQATGETPQQENNQENSTTKTAQAGPVRRLVLKEYFPYFATRKQDFGLDAGDFQEHLNWGKAHALKKAQFLTQMKSPHVATVRSYFEANNTVYLVRDYYEGITLAEWLRQKRLEHLVHKLDLSPDAISDAMLGEVKLSLDDTQKLLYPVIDALGFMHSYRASEYAYAHENISPDNIFLENILDSGPRAILFDGVGAGAKINPDLLAAGYSPPESYGQYESYKPSGDVYSLAAMLYSLLTGNVPAHAQERVNIKDNLDLDLTAVEPDLDDKLEKALNPNPNQRYGSALSFLQALQAPVATSTNYPVKDLPLPTGIDNTNSLNNAPLQPTAFIELDDTIEGSLDSLGLNNLDGSQSQLDSLDPALKATEIGSILWSDPSDDMLPVTYGDNASGKANAKAVSPAIENQNLAQQQEQVNQELGALNAQKQSESSPEIIFNHPDFFQVDESDTLAQATPVAKHAKNDAIFDLTHDTIEDSQVYNYSESVKLSPDIKTGLTAPESFLTQEREISIEEAKNTLFSIHPVHPMQAGEHSFQADNLQPDNWYQAANAHQASLSNDQKALANSANEQAVLHHAELLKGSSAFQYIDGKLSNNQATENKLTLQEDYTNTVIFNTSFGQGIPNEGLPQTNLQATSALEATALKQTGIQGLSQWPMSALTATQTRQPRERKPVQKRLKTLTDVFKTGFSAEHTESSTPKAEGMISVKPQQIIRVVMLILLLGALGVLIYTSSIQTPRTPFQNGTARASGAPTQNINQNVAQNIKYTSSTQPSLVEGEQLRVIPEFVLNHHKQAVRAVAFSPAGNLIASAGDDKQILLWNSSEQSIIKTLTPITGNDFIKDIAFSSDYLASVDTSGMVVLWDIYSGAKSKMDLYKHGAALNTVSFSSDATFLAAGAEDGKVLIWEYADNRFGKMQLVDMSQKAITNLQFHPTDNTLLVAADESLRVHLWDTSRSRAQTITAWNTMSRLNDIQFSSDGSRLALAGLDKESIGIVNVWETASRQLELSLYHPKFRSEGFSIRPESANSVRAITADPAGQWWASAGVDGIIHLWSATSGALIQSMATGQKGIYALDANPLQAGLVTAAADGSVQTWLLE